MENTREKEAKGTRKSESRRWLEAVSVAAVVAFVIVVVVCRII